MRENKTATRGIPADSAPGAPDLARRTAARGLAAVALEFAKLRRKRIWLIAFGLLAFELAWIGAQAPRMAQKNPDFQALLFQFSLMNAIFFPLIATVVASTVTDLEAKANMLKELLTMQDARGLYRAKWAADAIVIAVVALVQTAAMFALAFAVGMTRNLPGAATVALYTASTVVVTLAVATIVQALCLFAKSPFAPIIVGVAFAFAGLFGLYLPPAAAQFIPSSYYGLLATVSMSYDEASNMTTFAAQPWSIGHFAAMLALIAVAFALSARAFSRKEL